MQPVFLQATKCLRLQSAQLSQHLVHHLGSPGWRASSGPSTGGISGISNPLAAALKPKVLVQLSERLSFAIPDLPQNNSEWMFMALLLPAQLVTENTSLSSPEQDSCTCLSVWSRQSIVIP